MAIVLIAPTRDTQYWKSKMQSLDPELAVYLHHEVTEELAAKITCAVTWLHPEGALAPFPNLRLICSMGAGVDHFLSDGKLPADVPITRIVDPALAEAMSTFLLTAVLNHHRQWGHFVAQQASARWAQQDPCELPLRIGVLGLGVLGQDFAKKATTLGFPVSGYSQGAKHVPGISSFHGKEQLDAFLQANNLLVCMLPLTPATENILNRQFFDRCTPGTYLINVARGKHLVEEDLLPAIDAGQLSGAVLDVFRQEPLPTEHPFWQDDRVVVTPHHASLTNPDAAIPQIIENYHRMQKGRPLHHQIDLRKGY